MVMEAETTPARFEESRIGVVHASSGTFHLFTGTSADMSAGAAGTSCPMPLTFSGSNVGHGFRPAAGLPGGVPRRRPIGVPTRFGAGLWRATPSGSSAAGRKPCPTSLLAKCKWRGRSTQCHLHFATRVKAVSGFHAETSRTDSKWPVAGRENPRETAGSDAECGAIGTVFGSVLFALQNVSGIGHECPRHGQIRGLRHGGGLRHCESRLSGRGWRSGCRAVGPMRCRRPRPSSAPRGTRRRSERPGERRGQRIAGADRRDGFHARRSGFPQLIRAPPMDGPDSAAAAER